jgi:DNA-binding MarR family transcriptional regulator
LRAQPSCGDAMNPHESVGKWISIIYRQIRIFVDKELKTYNISSSQIQILSVIIRNDGIHQEAISKILHLDKANITRAVNKLITEKLVIREIDSKDKRAYLLHLTKRGKEFEPEINKILKKTTSILLTDFNEEEKVIAVKLLKKMHTNILTANN